MRIGHERRGNDSPAISCAHAHIFLDMITFCLILSVIRPCTSIASGSKEPGASRVRGRLI
jgi:hypothetical protein